MDKMLKQFGVTEADTPVVACAHMLLLRNPSNQQLANEIGLRQTPFEKRSTICSSWLLGPWRTGGGRLRGDRKGCKQRCLDCGYRP